MGEKTSVQELHSLVLPERFAPKLNRREQITVLTSHLRGTTGILCKKVNARGAWSWERREVPRILGV